MSDRWVLAHDPREGEHPEPMDLCPHGVDQHEAGCGQCLADDLQPMTTAEMTEAFAAFFRDTLDKIDGGAR
jgi:hypothetical protein